MLCAHVLILLITIVMLAPAAVSAQPILDPVLPDNVLLNVVGDIGQGDIRQALERALNSTGDQIELDIEAGLTVGVFANAGGSVNFQAFIERTDDGYEVGLGLGQQIEGGVEIVSGVEMAVAAGAGGRVIFLFDSIGDIERALQQMAVAILLKPAGEIAKAAINAADGALQTVQTLAQEKQVKDAAVDIAAAAVDASKQIITDLQRAKAGLDNTAYQLLHEINALDATFVRLGRDIDRFGTEMQRLSTDIAAFGLDLQRAQANLAVDVLKAADITNEIAAVSCFFLPFLCNDLKAALSQLKREINMLRNVVAWYEQEIPRLQRALQSYRQQLAAAQRQRDGVAAQKIDKIHRRHQVIEQARRKQAERNREEARQIQLIDAQVVAEAAYRQVVNALANARAALDHARRQVDASQAAWQDSQTYLQGAAFVIEFGGGGDLSAQLAPFEGVGLGASLNTAVSVSGRLDLDAQGVPASFTLSSRGEATLQAQANFAVGVQGAALVGFETEQLFVFENGRYREIGEAWLTLLIDVHAQGGVGAFVTVNAGAGQRLSLKIDMLQFQNHQDAFEHLIRYGDPAPLERALADTAFTLSLQSRWTASVAAGFDVSVAGNGVNFSADFTWTDKGDVIAVEFTAEEGMQYLMHPDRIAEIGAALGAYLSDDAVIQADNAGVADNGGAGMQNR